MRGSGPNPQYELEPGAQLVSQQFAAGPDVASEQKPVLWLLPGFFDQFPR